MVAQPPSGVKRHHYITEKTMTNLANAIGRVMMTAVRLPRSYDKDKYISMRTFAQTEYRKGDQAYVIDCLMNDRHIDVS